MGAVRSLKSNLRYGRELVKSGACGMSSGRENYLDGRPLKSVLAQSARASLGLAALGACAGLVGYCVPSRRGRLAKTVACGVAGSALGFAAAFAWGTRELTGSMTRSATKHMGVVRDERWLSRHPIDYA